MQFAAVEGRHFWSNGYAWGTCEIAAVADGYRVKLSVTEGSVCLQRFSLGDAGEKKLRKPRTIEAGKSATWTIKTGA